MARAFSESERELLRAAARRIAPGALGEAAAAWERFDALAARGFDGRPPALLRQFKLYLALLRWSPLPRFGAPFDRLSPERQDAVLRGLERAPLALLRKGFWGLKAVVLLGCYGQVEVWDSIAYRPSPRGGNELLHARKRV